MPEHTEHVSMAAWSMDCIEGDCEHRDEFGVPEDTSLCPSMEMEVCVECMVEQGQARDAEWWEGPFAPWPHRAPHSSFTPDPPIFKTPPAGSLPDTKEAP